MKICKQSNKRDPNMNDRFEKKIYKQKLITIPIFNFKKIDEKNCTYALTMGHFEKSILEAETNTKIQIEIYLLG